MPLIITCDKKPNYGYPYVDYLHKGYNLKHACLRVILSSLHVKKNPILNLSELLVC